MKWPEPAVAAVIVKEDRKVLLLRTSSRWRLPGGKLPGGRDWLTALHELARETSGAVVRDQTLSGIYSSDSEGRVTASFLVTGFDGDVRRGEWFSVDSLPETLSSVDRQCIEDALKFQGEVFVR